MITISHKAKQFLVFSVKLLIVVGAFYFIYNQLATNDKLDWDKFEKLVQKKLQFWESYFYFLLVLPIVIWRF